MLPMEMVEEFHSQVFLLKFCTNLTSKDSSAAVLQNCNFDSNQAIAGGAISLDALSSLTLISSQITKNTAVTDGGGINGLSSDINLQLVSNTISNNNAKRGGGILLTAVKSSLQSNTLNSNVADFGAGIYFDFSKAPSLYVVLDCNVLICMKSCITDFKLNGDCLTKNHATSSGIVKNICTIFIV